MRLLIEFHAAWSSSMEQQHRPANWALVPLALAFLILLGSVAFACPPASGQPAITTAESAIAAARDAWKSISDKASWNSIYSKENTDKFEPYTAVLQGDVWIVRGTVPAGFHGETLETTVCRSDGSVLAKGVQK
jgi:hypothetical protein